MWIEKVDVIVVCSDHYLCLPRLRTLQKKKEAVTFKFCNFPFTSKLYNPFSQTQRNIWRLYPIWKAGYVSGIISKVMIFLKTTLWINNKRTKAKQISIFFRNPIWQNKYPKLNRCILISFNILVYIPNIYR